MVKRFKSPQSIIGFGTIIFTLAIFFAQGGFINMNPWYVVGMVIGAVLIIWGLLKNPESITVTNPLEDIKTDLTNMNMCEREVATKKAEQVCPEKIAKQIHNDFVALFGEDLATFAISLIQEITSKHDIQPLIEFFKDMGGILDTNNYGLKAQLKDNELYNSSRMDLSQKRLKLKMGRKKKATTQKNIHRVSVLTYGLNSSIILRGALNSVPEAKGVMPAVIKVTLESIETETEKILTQMLDDLENEWKVTINELQILPIR